MLPPSLLLLLWPSLWPLLWLYLRLSLRQPSLLRLLQPSLQLWLQPLLRRLGRHLCTISAAVSAAVSATISPDFSANFSGAIFTCSCSFTTQMDVSFLFGMLFVFLYRQILIFFSWPPNTAFASPAGIAPLFPFTCQFSRSYSSCGFIHLSVIFLLNLLLDFL